MRLLFTAGLLVTTALAAHAGQARDQIRIVGSSTVYPFVSTAAEHFGKGGKFKTPIVESTGTGGGFKLFCEGVGERTPDINNASRKIQPSEIEQCNKNGVRQIEEIAIGFDGIVVANAKGKPPLHLSKRYLFLALAKQVSQAGKLVDNPYTHWNQIDPALPNQPIEIYGPPPTSGTRDAFVELIMDEACKEFKEFAAAYADAKERQQKCRMMREDGKFIQVGEDDNVLVQKLIANPQALGILGFSFYEENSGKLQASPIEGTEPNYENIASNRYGISRSLYVYLKKEHLEAVPGLREFLRELTSEAAAGPEGYLSMKGLVALPDKDRDATREKAAKL